MCRAKASADTLIDELFPHTREEVVNELEARAELIAAA
jgi:hypothetical protein